MKKITLRDERKTNSRFAAGTFALIIWGSLAVSPAFAQGVHFSAVADVPFYQAGQALAHPLTGGLEAPQFVEMDLNGDGLMDLIAFDRVGGKALPFEAQQTPQGVQYRYAPDYEPYFPPLYQFLQTADLNCDGLDDLLTMRALSSAADVTLQAYLRLPTTDGTLAFEGHNLLLLDSASSQLRIHAFDLPAIADVNGDGLTDILYIPQNSTQIQYYENISLASGDCGDLVFELRDDCWGNASYELDGSFNLQACWPRSQGCAGSAMLATDYDGDGTKDMLFSSIYGHHIQLMMNGGDEQQAELVSQSTDWLLEGEPLMEFPAPYLIDFEQDGQQDLIIATNRLSGIGAGLSATEVYRLLPSAETGGWELVSTDFLIGDMLDHGFRSSPAVWDANGDGLPDILIAYNRPHNIYGYTAALALYLNVGTPTQPAFQLENTDFGGLSSYALKAIHPTFGDLDGDGQDELVIGLANGRLRTFKAPSEAQPQFTPLSPDPLADFQRNGFAKPQLVDINGNGLLDLACGTRAGITTLLENTGTPQSPVFEWVTDTLGGISPDGFFQENSAFLLPAEEGELWLYNGQFDGQISLYKGRAGEAFVLQQAKIASIDVGERASICLADLDADGLPELLVGNMRGGLELFRPQAPTAAGAQAPLAHKALLFPNPATQAGAYLSLPPFKQAAQFAIFDPMGRLLRRQLLAPGLPQYHIELQGLPAGFYFYTVHADEFMLSGKIQLTR